MNARVMNENAVVISAMKQPQNMNSDGLASGSVAAGFCIGTSLVLESVMGVRPGGWIAIG